MSTRTCTRIYFYNVSDELIEIQSLSGNMIASYRYDAWGNILSAEGAMADINPYRYASYRYDSETGLYYLSARYYEPKEGLFLSKNPEPGEANDPISQQPYIYVQNNPVMLDDPDGTHPLVWIAVRVGGKIVYKQVKKKVVPYVAKKYKGAIKSNKKSTGSVIKSGLNFTKTTAKHMDNAARFVPIKTLKQAIKGKGY